MLEIYKKGNKNFQHEDPDFEEYGANDIVIIFDGNTVKLRSVNGRVVFKKDGYHYSDVRVYNLSGSAELFPNVVSLKQRLINLGYPFNGSTVDVIELNEVAFSNVTGLPETNPALVSYIDDLLEDKEDDLGLPALDGYVLSSLADGTRYWTEMTGGGGTPTLNKTQIFPLNISGIDFNQEELKWVRDAVNNTAAINGGFSVTTGTQMVFSVSTSSGSRDSFFSVSSKYYRLTTGATTVTTLGTGNVIPLMPDGSITQEIEDDSDLIIDLGNIGTDSIEDAFNSSVDQPFTMTNENFVQATQDEEEKLWQWIGGAGTFGNSSTLALDTYFVELTNSDVPTEVILEEQIIGTATYSASDSGTVPLDLNLLADTYRIMTADTTYTFTNTPASGFSFTRSMTLKGEFAPIFTDATLVGEYLDDGTENDVEMKFTNYPTIGLRIWIYINQGNV